MRNYKLSGTAKEDLIRIHHYGIRKFGETQADIYFDQFFDYFELIAKQPFTFPSVGFLRKGYRRCVCGSDSIFFKVNNERVEIMAIIGSQDLGSVL